MVEPVGTWRAQSLGNGVLNLDFFIQGFDWKELADPRGLRHSMRSQRECDGIADGSVAVACGGHPQHLDLGAAEHIPNVPTQENEEAPKYEEIHKSAHVDGHVWCRHQEADLSHVELSQDVDGTPSHTGHHVARPVEKQYTHLGAIRNFDAASSQSTREFVWP